MKNPIQTFEPNLRGRDFAIGDLHGSYSALINLMANLEFDVENDRMFSVGDLVDRGPESLRCLELMREPWFHCVLSNHEQMMLEAFRGGYMGNFWLQNGGMWGVEALGTWKRKQQSEFIGLDIPAIPDEQSAQLWDLLDEVDELPYLITVNLKDGRKIHIIHAELPPGRVITDSELSSPRKVLDYATEFSGDGEFFLWGRHIYYSFAHADLSNYNKVVRTVAYRRTNMFNDNLSHIISGHTIVQKPLTILGQTNIDTCAYGSYRKDAPKWNALTCVELDTWQFYQATETEFRLVDPVIVNSSDIANLNKESQ